ncbi:MAG: thioredoxin-disulfide reductase [Candidatus Omnitrophota bacterium]|nr:MAG: thioredoxin-disulfide reductase [Candidatus Omnitrophota bacterium]
MHDLIIIGAGPAGLTAALYAGRFRLDTLIFEKMSAGGQVMLTPTIENYPGFPEGITSLELIDRFTRQIKDLGLDLENQEIVEVKVNSDKSPLTFSLKTQQAIYETKSIIIATGAKSRELGVEGEEKLIGRGVSYCATCDAPLFKNKEIVVVGGGDRAVEEAIHLASYAQKVNLVHRRAKLRASKILEEKARQNPKINFILDSVVEKIIGDKRVETVQIKNTKNNAQTNIDCQGIFIFVGIKPATVFLKNLLEMEERGFIITDQEMKTSQAGIFACGDCRKKSLYQVISAASGGATAADSAHKYLLNLK